MIKKFIRKMLGVKNKPNSSGANHQPTVLNAKEHGINPQLLSSNAIRVTQTLQENGFKAFVVGGAVRDLLLGVKPKDFDIATNATPEQVKRLFRRAFIIGRRFQIVHVMFGQDLLEVTTFRGAASDGSPKDEHGRVLRDNTFGEQHEDAVRRDFTINAMYYDPASQTVLDYHGGIADIRKKVLRIIGVPEARYREDPVRMLRVVRFAAKLQFSIDAATSAPIAVMAPLINNVPSARVFDEMLKLLMSGHAMACLQQLRKEGLHHGLMPLLDVVLEQPMGEKFVTLALANTALPCSRVLWNPGNGHVFVGRTQDWTEKANSAFRVFPRGMERSGAVAENPHKWTSKYGSLIITGYDIATHEGVNEKGLSAGILYLAGDCDYGKRDPKLAGIGVTQWVQYFLDNYATVAEAVEAQKNIPFQIDSLILPNSFPTLVHMSLSDKSGDSAVIEYVGGKAQIYHDKSFTVMTNEPTYDKQIENLKQYRTFGGDKPLPGERTPTDRFVRAA